ncbi:MAG: hypothetical protein R6V45_02355 [Oceanipulchritudo sp.]
MNLRNVAFLSAVSLAIPLSGDSLTVSIEAFADPTAFTINDGSNLSLRVAELSPAPSDNASTHVLVEGLMPVEDGTQVHASPYQGIDAESGEVQDVGLLYLDLPETASLPEGSVSSPIVGVLERPGSWEDFNLNTPSTDLGGVSGDGDYDSGVLDLSLVRDGASFSGSTSYTVIDENTIELDAFTLNTDGTDSFGLSSTTLLREGDHFYGTVTNLSEGAGYDSLIFSILLTDIPDLDSDGIPDIVDDSIEAGEGLIEDWQRLEFTWVWGLTPEWGISTYMGYIYVPNLPYVYAEGTGWLFHVESADTDHLFYSWDKGWITVSENNGGFYYAYTDSVEDGEWFQFPQAG